MSENACDRVSVIIPARNEEANIERCVRSVAGQRGVRLREIIVVDDQSTDRTPAILEGLKTEIPALRVVRIESLPPGWLGKCYALATGAKTAGGDWVLFTDADTEHLPGSLAESLERCEQGHVDLFSLSPAQLTPTWWERACIPLIYVWLSKAYRFDEVNDPASPAAAANGQYMLIRREVYEKIGGHAAVKGEILDDVALAEKVKSSGGRLLFLPGAGWVRTRMYRSFPEMWKGWTKNLYLLGRGSARAILRAVVLSALTLGTPAAFLVLLFFLVDGPAQGILVLGCALLAGIVLVQYRRYVRQLTALGFDSRCLYAYWPGAAMFAALLVSSLWAHRRSGKVEWKGRGYSTKGAATS